MRNNQFLILGLPVVVKYLMMMILNLKKNISSKEDMLKLSMIYPKVNPKVSYRA